MNRHIQNNGFRPKRILFVFNPKAGRRKNRIQKEILEDFCKKQLLEYQILDLTEDGLSETCLDYKPDLVVAAGGDGTVNAAGKIVLNTKIPLAVIPLGSSNGFAKNLSIPCELSTALHTLVNGHLKTIDTLDVNGEPCFHLCDVGINAALIARSQHSKIRGMLTYFLNFWKELMGFHNFDYVVTTHKEKVSGKAFSIIVTNEKMFGTNAVINPSGRINDGLFEICIIKPFPIYRLPRLVFTVFHRNIYNSGYSIFLRTSKAEIQNPDLEHINIDGEPIEKSRSIEITIRPSSLKVLVPFKS